MTGTERTWRARSLDDLRLLGETVAVVLVTWVLLGWIFDRPIAQADGTVQWIPYLRSTLAGGASWGDNLYRFGVLGGSTMHDAAGTLPLVQLCAVFGLGATTTANVLTVFLQVAIGFFSVLCVRGLVGAWLGAPVSLVRAQRICVVWACAFAPWLGWRLAWGHENLVLGLLPFVACGGLVAIARSEMPSPIALAFATFVVWTGLSGLGGQMVVYAAVFGGPTLAMLLFAGARPRFARAQVAALAALVAGVLLALPRVAGMIAHVASDDFPREGGLTYSFGVSGWRDWLGSLPWTTSLVPDAPAFAVHESNLPLGPFVVFLVAWPLVASRRILWVAGGSLLVAILFASNVPPVSTVLPIFVLIVPIALAAWFTRIPDPAPRRTNALAVFAAAATIIGLSFVPSLWREPLAIGAAVLVVVLARRHPTRAHHLAPVVILIAALGVCAFGERFPRHLPVARIEQGPAALRTRLIADLPELASPLVRVQIVKPGPPYEMSTAFAAGLSSLDGAWYPTRRYLAMLSALQGKPIPSTAGIFQLTRTPAFPALQQLYNVRYVVDLGGETAVVTALPPTPGAAWFPREIVAIDDPREMTRALAAGAKVGEVAWIRPSENTGSTSTTVLVEPGGKKTHVAPPGCMGGSVASVEVDRAGQRATLTVDSPGDCFLVVATNFTRNLRATAGGQHLPVFPIDVALTGIAVPRGRHAIVLAPVAYEASWGVLSLVVGLALLGIAIALGSGWKGLQQLARAKRE